jgi:predicted metal-dependent peptidase
MTTQTQTKANLKEFLNKVQLDKDEKENKATQVKNASERKNVLNLKILCVVDVSGSISREQYNSFMSQLNKIRGMSMVKVIETDTDVVAVYDYYKTNMDRVVKLGGGGGTDFKIAFHQAVSVVPDAILCLTDGDDSGSLTLEQMKGIPVGWVVTSHGHAPYPWGIEITKVDK